MITENSHKYLYAFCNVSIEKTRLQHFNMKNTPLHLPSYGKRFAVNNTKPQYQYIIIPIYNKEDTCVLKLYNQIKCVTYYDT